MLHITCSAVKNLKACSKKKRYFWVRVTSVGLGDAISFQRKARFGHKVQHAHNHAAQHPAASRTLLPTLGWGNKKAAAQLPFQSFVLNSSHLRAPSQYFQSLTITKSRKNEGGQWHHNDVIGMLQKKVTKKRKQTQLKYGNHTSSQQGKEDTGPSKATETQIIMCSLQSRNKHAVLNSFQVYFQRI